MKKITFILFISFLCFIAQAQTHDAQKKFFPKEIKKYYLGMTKADFLKLNKKIKLATDTSMHFRIEVVQKNVSKRISDVTYYFNNNKTYPLYEFIIKYKKIDDLESDIQALLGKPNSGKEWLYNCGESWKLKAWSFENKLVIIGIIPGTEWAE